MVLPAGEGLEECFFLARIATVFLLAFRPAWLQRQYGSKAGFSDGCAHMPACLQLSCWGSSTSQIDVFCTAVVLTIIPNGPWKRGLSMASGQLALQKGTLAPRRRTEAAWKCSATHNGIQARQVGE